MPIAENLKYWQSLRDMTTAELAEKSGIPDATITKIRTRVTHSPNMDTLQKLAKALQCSINDLTDTPSMEDDDLRDLLPKKMPTDVNELTSCILTALRNQNIAHERTLSELRKDRNFWRKFAVVSVSCMVPLLLATLILLAVLYWDLSHPTQGNIGHLLLHDIVDALQ